jgi:ubiquinone/menaquinone biosynthesis C-methylase UbiE
MLLQESRVPPKGLVLNVACGTGYPALDLLEKMEGGRIIAIDSSSALLDIARGKAGDMSGKRIFFRTEGGKEKLSFDDDVYDLTFSNLGLGDLSISSREAVAEFARVTAPGGQVLVTLPLRGTWLEFLDIYREVLTKHDRHDTLEQLTEYMEAIPEPETAIGWLEEAGLEEVDLVVEEFSLLFKSSREFFFAPVIEFGPLREWKRIAGKGQEMQDIFWFIKEAIDAYFGDRAFSVTVVAGCLSGIKPQRDEDGDESGPDDGDLRREQQRPTVPANLGPPGDLNERVTHRKTSPMDPLYEPEDLSVEELAPEDIEVVSDIGDEDDEEETSVRSSDHGGLVREPEDSDIAGIGSLEDEDEFDTAVHGPGKGPRPKFDDVD